MLEPLVLLPGLGCDEALWRAQIVGLADVASCIVGETRLDDTMGAIAERVLAAAPSRFALGGLSMGGYVAFEIMRRAPERVTRLALFDTGAHADTADASAARHFAMAILDTVDLATAGRASLPRLVADDAPEDVRDAVVAMGVRVGRDAYVRQQYANISRADSRPLLGVIAVPTIVVVGERDVLTPPALAREMAAGIPGAALHVVPGSGHLPSMERPDQVTALLRQWLSRG